MISRTALRVPPTGANDTYVVSRIPAVWLLDPDAPLYVVIAGRRYLAARPDLDPVECRILDAKTLEEAQAIVTKRSRGRPSRKQLTRLAERISALPEPFSEEKAFLAALEYVTTGLVKGWPPRIASRNGKLPRSDH
jgi:hypothetical protein